jgi:RimJ/RimL family protein N-acetyltransferase/enamine deaminase RidA (YjgF/YER057c/UK114 family)
VTTPHGSPNRLWGEQPTLDDGVIELAPLSMADIETIAAWDSDPDTQRWFDWPQVRSDGYDALESAKRTVEEKRKGWELGAEAVFAVRRAGEPRSIGWCDLHFSDGGRAEVAYGILPAHRGRGVASRAVALIASWAFSQLGVARVELKAGTQNLASRAVARRAGFTPEGVMREHSVHEHYEPLMGQRFDVVLYSRLAGDPVPQHDAAAGTIAESPSRGAEMPRELITIPGQDPPAWYSPAARFGDLVWVAGQVGVHAGGTVADGITDQVHAAIDNVEAALEAAGASLETLLSVQVFLADMADFDAYNEAYLERIADHGLPARATVGAALAEGLKVEITAVAHVAGR